MVINTTVKTTMIWPQRILVADMATEDQVPSIVIDKSYILPGVQVAFAAYNLGNELRVLMPVANMKRLGLRSIRSPSRRRVNQVLERWLEFLNVNIRRVAVDIRKK